MPTEIVVKTEDGERLACTLYLPSGDGQHASLIEALPYRKDDVTQGYASTYERYAAAGFAVLRVDVRGTGSSSGIPTDVYPDVERTDLRSAIEWLTSQPWSNGKVGMFGTSYSGFNGLQMAAEIERLEIPALAAVVAAYATDDRYTDDVHFCGGVLRAIDLIDYPLYMVAMNALPPVPAVFDTDDTVTWRDEWRRRVDEAPPWLLGWLEHPTDDETWRRGSIRLGPDGDGYERMGCPTMIIAGWADGYRNNTFRVIEQYERNGLPWRLLAGPWVHKSPEVARPGPNIDDDAEIIAFFDEHLRGGPPAGHANGQVFVRRPVVPEPDLVLHPGVWRDIESWPPAGLREVEFRPVRTGIESVVVRGDVGVAAWNSCGGALPWGQPLDQREDNARSICLDWPITERAEIVGNGRVALRLRTDQAYGHVSVKLCDVFPDGTSALITRGMLDLTHVGCWPADANGVVGGAPMPLTPGAWMDVEVGLEATTWTLEPGHTVRLAVAGTDWPNCWPPPGPVTLELDADQSALTLPIVDGLAESTHAFRPGSGPCDTEGDGAVWQIEHDVLGRETRVVTRYGDTYEGDHGAVITDDYRGELGVSTTDPANAWARGTSSFEISWPEVTVRTDASLSVRSDGEAFDVELTVVAHEGDKEFGRRTWAVRLPR